MSGNQIAELGPALWIIFIMLLFPLIMFTTLGTRYIFLASAARLAASSASKCSTFQADANPPTDCSAVHTATQIANQSVSPFTGITLTSITCYITTSPLSGAAVSRQTSPLTKAADSNANSYNFEVVLQAQLSPLIPFNNKYLSQIPGLGRPLTTSAKADVFFESTQGLTQ